ncbi:hypothetical protein ABZ819_24500 [Streptomyces venezuelae]|uniref:hypothetical protein n=1 Tax=Streptomyces venezuelae TaxID=54571 RepID=UPI0034358A93
MAPHGLRVGEGGAGAVREAREVRLRPDAFVRSEGAAPVAGARHREQPRPPLQHGREGDGQAQADDHREQRRSHVGGEPLPGALREYGRQQAASAMPMTPG